MIFMELRVALIILYDTDGKILLQQRTNDAKVLPGYWGFFGGSIDNGETPEQAVRRETMEELNYDLKNEKLFIEQNFRFLNAEGHMYLFIAPLFGDKSSLSLNEGQGWGWFCSSEIDNLNMLEHDKQIASRVLEYLDESKSH